MRIILSFLLCLLPFLVSSCSSNVSNTAPYTSYESRLPTAMPVGEKVILVDPSVHAWGAYNEAGTLVRAGLATSGANWCADLKRPCHTHPGTFHISMLGDKGCKSSLFPMPRGGAPMPYCMFFNGRQALHGSYSGQLAEANLSHGCVRMPVSDAEWLRNSFVSVGTKVVIEPY
jgi:hypothetical protein